MILFFVTEQGYAMQPPPPPLDSVQLQKIIAEADVIVVGQIERVKKTEEVDGAKKIIVEAVVKVEKLLKGKVPSKDIRIRESYPSFSSITVEPTSKEDTRTQKTIISTVAGPRCYHGRYQEGARIVVLLAVIEGAGEYKPLGSGTYDKHLCEFLIENGSIKTLYFKFADDVERYTQSEKKFISLIERLLKKSQADDNNGRWWIWRLLF